MRTKELSNLEIADLCRELALLMHAGVGLGDGLTLLCEEEKDPAYKAMLSEMAQDMDAGMFLSQAMERTGRFPTFMIGLVRVGELAGNQEEALNALAVYHENRERMRRQLVSSLTYPAILLVLMLVVIVVLLSQVLPVFNEIYQSLGGQLTGMAGGLLLLGQLLDRGIPVLCGLLALVLVFGGLFWLNRSFRGKVMGVWNARWGDRGIARKWNNARFAQALAMGFHSGLPLEEAVDMAGKLLENIPGAALRCKTCYDMLMQGEELSHALGQTGLLTPSACRLLTLGIRSGSGDSVMEEISRRTQDEAQQALENAVSKVEPALVLVTSALVGVILLSVMLPLMNIMTAIG